ncbi:hypothetical protein ACGFMM_01645 [Streptomyces sp. NPDC048604]|uniref:hypothetical protein n=1 Tax=Streptomyces sp. NPDC048604 TaxID=3365578 RepID=UPI00371A2057
MMHSYAYWTRTGTAASYQPPIACLTLCSTDDPSGTSLQMQFPSSMSVEEQLIVADRVLAGVQKWRDGIAEWVETSNRNRAGGDR